MTTGTFHLPHAVLAPTTRIRTATASTPVKRLITWREVSRGLWSGQIGDDFAGLIETTRDGFVLSDWKGSTVGTYDSLGMAQLDLEPEQRARYRRQRSDEQSDSLRTSIVACLIATPAVALSAFAVGMLVAR